MMQRRKFFAALLAPVAALAVPKVKAVAPRPEDEALAKMNALIDDWNARGLYRPVAFTTQLRLEVIGDAMIMVGILAPGETPSANAIALAERELERHAYPPPMLPIPADLARWLMPYYRDVPGSYVSAKIPIRWNRIPTQDDMRIAPAFAGRTD